MIYSGTLFDWYSGAWGAPFQHRDRALLGLTYGFQLRE